MKRAGLRRGNLRRPLTAAPRGAPGLESSRDNGSRRGVGTQTAARARWPIARFRLGEEPPEDLSQVTTHTERIAMMWFLAETAWKVAGWPWPRYERRTIPARLFRPGTPPPDDR